MAPVGDQMCKQSYKLCMSGLEQKLLFWVAQFTWVFTVNILSRTHSPSHFCHLNWRSFLKRQPQNNTHCAHMWSLTVGAYWHLASGTGCSARHYCMRMSRPRGRTQRWVLLVVVFSMVTQTFRSESQASSLKTYCFGPSSASRSFYSSKHHL